MDWNGYKNRLLKLGKQSRLKAFFPVLPRAQRSTKAEINIPSPYQQTTKTAFTY